MRSYLLIACSILALWVPTVLADDRTWSTIIPGEVAESGDLVRAYRDMPTRVTYRHTRRTFHEPENSPLVDEFQGRPRFEDRTQPSPIPGPDGETTFIRFLGDIVEVDGKTLHAQIDVVDTEYYSYQNIVFGTRKLVDRPATWRVIYRPEGVRAMESNRVGSGYHHRDVSSIYPNNPAASFNLRPSFQAASVSNSALWPDDRTVVSSDGTVFSHFRSSGRHQMTVARSEAEVPIKLISRNDDAKTLGGVQLEWSDHVVFGPFALAGRHVRRDWGPDGNLESDQLFEDVTYEELTLEEFDEALATFLSTMPTPNM